jgi:hypothetical protein
MLHFDHATRPLEAAQQTLHLLHGEYESHATTPLRASRIPIKDADATGATSCQPVAELAPLPKSPRRALPPSLKASYCPTCGGRTVVVSPAADHLLCAGCAPAWQPRIRDWKAA